MLDTYQVLQQISKYWKDMTNAERSSLAITLAKKTQMDTFLATLSNFEDAEKAYTTALLSEGSAWKENEEYMKSIEAHQAKLKAQWEQLVLSAPIEEFEKALLSAGTTLLNFANSGIGQAIIKLTLLVTTMALVNKAFTAFQTLIAAKNATSVFISGIMSLISGEATLLQTTKALTIAMEANPLFWGAAIATAIYAAYKAIQYLTTGFERNAKAVEELNQQYKEAKQEVESLEEKVKNIGDLISETESRKLEIIDEEELKKLDRATEELTRQEAVLKYQLQLAKMKADEAEREAKAKAQSFKDKKEKATVYSYDTQGGLYGEGAVSAETFKGTPQEIFQKEVEGLESIEKQIESNKQSIAELSQNYQQNEETIKQLEQANADLVDVYNDVESKTIDTASSLLNIIELGLDTDGVIQGLLDKYHELVTTGEEVVNGNEQIADSEEEVEGTINAVSEAFSQAVEPLSDIENNYALICKAVDEFNTKGGVTASTLNKLSKLDAQWLSLLQLENGQLVINEQGVTDLADAYKQEAIATLQAQAAQDMMNVAMGNYEALSPLAQQAINDITTETQNETKAAKDNTVANLIEAESYDILTEAKNKAKGTYDPNGTRSNGREEIYAQIDAIFEKYSALINGMDSWNLHAVDSAKSAAGGHKDAWVEAFKEEQRQLKHALEMNEITEIEYYQKLKDLNEKYFGEISGNHQKYIKEYQENEEEIYKGMKAIYDKVADYLREAIEQGYEDAINALKKEEKKVLAEIKAQIEALKDEKKKVLDDIQNQIDGLKKKKDKVQDYWNSQIDKIKESNSELQKQNELLEKQQALQRAKAQKVMVMKDGKFQLGENESAVAQAEQNLAQYQDQMSYEQQISEMEKLRDAQVETIDDRIEKLEEYKDYMEDYYDEQIDALEKYYDQVEKQYEEQIEALQEQLDAFKKHAEEQKKIEEARLAAQLLGIEKESDLFEISLANLEDYVAKYNALVASMEVPSVFADGLGNIPIGGSAPSGGGGGKGTTITKYASGAANIRSNEIALVGESPNAELVVGSHLNRSMGGGTLLNLSKGSGVVNAESTATLAGLLNGVVTPTNVSNSRSTMQTFTFGNLTLPNVTDAESFVNTLSHKFNNYAIQYGNSRK